MQLRMSYNERQSSNLFYAFCMGGPFSNIYQCMLFSCTTVYSFSNNYVIANWVVFYSSP